MRKIILSLSAALLTITASAQTIADVRAAGTTSTPVTVSGVATNGSELGSIRYFQDGTAGIAGYGGPITGVSRGDSITVTGPVIEFAGLLEISTVTNVVNHGPANVMPAPLQIPITSAGEPLEAQLVEIQNVTFVETGNFTISGSGATYTINDGTNDLDVRVNNSSNFNGQPIPTGPVTITGLIGQYNANYQIIPRDMNDIVPYVAPAYEINVLLEGNTVLHNADYFVGNSSTVNVTIENLGSTDLNVTGATFTGADAADFSSNIGATIIAGGSSQSFTINYTPSGVGSHFAAIEIGSNDTDENPYIINFEGVGTDNLATEPTANPTNLTFPTVKSYTLGGQYAAGTGATNYLVLWKNGSAITGTPVDGTTYLRGDVVGDARVAYVGAGTAFTPRGIIANQDYYFAVYAFNGSGGFENYLTTSPATGNTTSLGENIGTYYNGISTASTTFADDLNALINPHTQITYFMYKQTMMAEFEIRDTTNGQSYVTCVYTGEKKVFDDPFDWTATGYSREHTFPHSWMPTWPADSPEEPEYTDQHNLYPTNLAEANTPRSNLPFGDITGNVVDTYLEGNIGEVTPGGPLVYEPRDEQKGNAARAIMYMAVAYDFPLTGNVNSDKQDEALLKDWHFGDLPDNYEIARHEYIFDLQGNRNPFIDSVNYACFIDFDDNAHIANGCSTNSLEEKVQDNLVVYPVPANDVVYVQVNGVEIEAYQVVDMQGRVVLNVQDIQESKIMINADQIVSGSYMIKVETAYGSAQKSLIIK